MIAAAASDGRIDDTERARILGALKAVGIDGDGARLIEHELDHPATAADLAAAAKTPEMAVQAYTAARRIITPNTVDERVFLAHLSAALGLAPHIVAHIDAERRWTDRALIAERRRSTSRVRTRPLPAAANGRATIRSGPIA